VTAIYRRGHVIEGTFHPTEHICCAARCASYAELVAIQTAAADLGAKRITWGIVTETGRSWFAFDVYDVAAFEARCQSSPDNLFVQRCTWQVDADRGAQRNALY
jgi:hypothetical protein